MLQHLLLHKVNLLLRCLAWYNPQSFAGARAMSHISSDTDSCTNAFHHVDQACRDLLSSARSPDIAPVMRATIDRRDAQEHRAHPCR